ncbi:hypothetical protein [Noviherbaspirillum sp.]|jgi:Tfp pilus assembly protein PilX|uniref:pilus assembly PilX family protein n=1 Tax=Noviherbaspirillum sp. TaxID=1926288 RepID=UPI0025F1B6D4|nr:hypothetical protein [Noviherbaspirillum sp.]
MSIERKFKLRAWSGVPRAMRLQRGVVLIVALIVLIAMTLASIAMVRSVDTSTIIAGNLAFKESGAAAGDVAIDTAIIWLAANNSVAVLGSDHGSDGYYASLQDNLDITGTHTADNNTDNLDWTSSAVVKKLDKDALGNQASYVIHRMCNDPGPFDPATCASDLSPTAGNSLGSKQQNLNYHVGGWDQLSARAYYRITVRIKGPKNSINFVQMIVAP